MGAESSMLHTPNVDLAASAGPTIPDQDNLPGSSPQVQLAQLDRHTLDWLGQLQVDTSLPVSQPLGQKCQQAAAAKSQQSPSFSDFTLYPDRFSRRANSISSDSSMSSLVAARRFAGLRMRSMSSNSDDGTQTSPDTSRQRSASQESSKLYYFDFTLIPDKDPNCAVNERRMRRRLLSTGDLDTHPEERCTLPDSSAASLQATKATQGGKRHRLASVPSKFCFFDFSMIPDKDPRFRPSSSPRQQQLHGQQQD